MLFDLIRFLPILSRQKSLERDALDVETRNESVGSLHDRNRGLDLHHVLTPILIEVGDDGAGLFIGRFGTARCSDGRFEDLRNTLSAINIFLHRQPQQIEERRPHVDIGRR